MTTTTPQDFTDTLAVRSEMSETGYVGVDRNEAIAAIRKALKARTGMTWSVRGDHGTAWGWINIDAQPKRRTARWIDTGQKDESGSTVYALTDTGEAGGTMTPADHDTLCAALGLDESPGSYRHWQGISIPAGSDYRREYIQRAEGRIVDTIGTPYWD